MLQILWSTFNCCRSLSQQATYFSQDAEGRRRYNKFVLRGIPSFVSRTAVHLQGYDSTPLPHWTARDGKDAACAADGQAMVEGWQGCPHRQHGVRQSLDHQEAQMSFERRRGLRCSYAFLQLHQKGGPRGRGSCV